MVLARRRDGVADGWFGLLVVVEGERQVGRQPSARERLFLLIKLDGYLWSRFR